MTDTFYGCANITSSQRSEIINKECSPGPGFYIPTMEDSKKIPQWTLKPKIDYTSCFYDRKKNIPAPGSYNINSSQVIVERAQNKRKEKKEKDFKIPKDSKKSYLQKSAPMTHINLPSFVDGGKLYSFGYRDEVVVKEASPGPIYHVDEKINQSRLKKIKNSCQGFGLGERNSISKDQMLFPGPGKYISKQKQSSTGYQWSFSKSAKKPENSCVHSLGPGQYNPILPTSNRGCKIKKKNQYEKQNDYEAAPGSYNIPDTFSKKGVGFKSAAKNKEIQSQTSSPSPFSYNPCPSTLKPNGYSLAKKLEIYHNNIENPGPGSYKLSENHQKWKGGYMGRKKQVKKNMNQSQDNFYKYNPNLNATSYQSPQYSFSQTSFRNFGRNQSNIGPGAYDSHVCDKKSESYTIPKNKRFKTLQKQNIKSNINSKNPYSTIGNLPSYIQKQIEKKKQINRKHAREPQNTAD